MPAHFVALNARSLSPSLRLPGRNSVWVIHRQNFNRCSSNRGSAFDSGAIPLEMISPQFGSRIEEANDLP
jgi:hypothetical protein